MRRLHQQAKFWYNGSSFAFLRMCIIRNYSQGGTNLMEKCPYCSAETRPGDNFCLNCGNRLLVATPSFQQAQPVLGDATLPAEEDWVPPAPIGGSTAPASNSWSVSSEPTIVEPIGTTDDTALPTLQAMARAMASDKPPSAHVIIRNDKGEVLNERSLEKLEMSIG